MKVTVSGPSISADVKYVSPTRHMEERYCANIAGLLHQTVFGVSVIVSEDVRSSLGLDGDEKRIVSIGGKQKTQTALPTLEVRSWVLCFKRNPFLASLASLPCHYVKWAILLFRQPAVQSQKLAIHRESALLLWWVREICFHAVREYPDAVRVLVALQDPQPNQPVDLVDGNIKSLGNFVGS